MKNVLIITPDLGKGGGAQKIAGNLGFLLEREGFNTIHLTFTGSESPYRHAKRVISLDQKKKKSKTNFFRVFGRARKIKQICKDYNIHTKISFLEDCNFANILSSIMGDKAKTIISVRNNPEVYLKKSPFYANIMKKTYNKADLTVCVAKGVEDSLKKDYNINNTTTIYNMIDTQEEEKKKTGFSTSPPNLLMIGRLTEQKGYKELFRTIRHMKTKPNIYIIGDGEDREELKQKKPDNITFLGKKDNVRQYINASDAVLSYSRWEGMGNILLESINQNIPVISTDHKHGAREIIAKITDYNKSIEYPYKTDTGILITPLDHKDFSYKKSAEELEQAIRDIKTIKNPKRRAKDFDESRIIEEWKRII